MKYTDIALKVWALQEADPTITNESFAGRFPTQSAFIFHFNNNPDAAKKLNQIRREITQYPYTQEDSVVCVFDEHFPNISTSVCKNEKPYLLFCRGDASLLRQTSRNIAVIGYRNPTADIIHREQIFVSALCRKGLNIVSGLAKGCDTIAHETCLNISTSKTIAILSSPVYAPYPPENIPLAKRIASNGLLVSEYARKGTNKDIFIKRLIDRDRLQAMFASAVILTASYRHHVGDRTKDGGSRHALNAAERYGIDRYALYNNATDAQDEHFELNRDIITKMTSPAKQLLHSSIIHLANASRDALL